VSIFELSIRVVGLAGTFVLNKPKACKSLAQNWVV
jgi:hypothetical protein